MVGMLIFAFKVSFNCTSSLQNHNDSFLIDKMCENILSHKSAAPLIFFFVFRHIVILILIHYSALFDMYIYFARGKCSPISSENVCVTYGDVKVKVAETVQ